MTAEKSTEFSDLAGLDRLIHEPGRLAIMGILYVAARADFLYLQRETELTRGNLSAHLSKLEEAGYIEIEKTFEGKKPRTMCKQTDKGRKAFDTYLKQMNNTLSMFE